MRVLFLNPCAQLGGAERCLLDVIASLRRCEPGWRLHLITGEDGPLIALAKRQGAAASCLPFPEPIGALGAFGMSPQQLAGGCLRALPSILSYRRSLLRAIRRIAPDIVHTNGFKMHLLAAAARGAPAENTAPLVWHLHDYLETGTPAARALRIAARKCTGAIAISSSISQNGRRALPVSVHVVSIPNGVDLANFHPRGPRLDLDALTGISAPTGAIRVGLVATYARWKGHEIFLRALADPCLHNLRFQPYIIGGPVYQTRYSQFTLEELHSLARDCGVYDRVIFTGFLQDSAAALRALDVVVHASTRPEPFGLVVAEAMACGRATIVARTGGANELFVHDRDAIGTESGSPAALAQAIACLVNDRVTRARLGSAARLTAEAQFDRDRLGPATAAFYRQMVYPCDYSTSTAAISTAA